MRTADMIRGTGVLALAMTAFAAYAQDGEAPGARARPPVSAYPTPRTFPNEDKAKVAEYLARARRIAGTDLVGDFNHRCIFDARYRQRVNAMQYNGILEPQKVFDQLYSIGQIAVSAWALNTSDGIVLFDALNSADEARDIIVPNLRAVGLDPARIKYVVITHSHGDHYGGAEYLKQQFGARLISSAEDWAVMDDMRASGRTGPFPVPPARDIAVTDGQVMTVGNTILRFYVTPGHTPGTLSTIFRVTDNGAPHTVAFFGGFGSPQDPQKRYGHIASMQRFAGLAKAAGADTMIANHPVQDGAMEKLEMIRYRRPGEPNPYVLGSDTVQRYFGVQEACSRVALIRAGLDPERSGQIGRR